MTYFIQYTVKNHHFSFVQHWLMTFPNNINKGNISRLSVPRFNNTFIRHVYDPCENASHSTQHSRTMIHIILRSRLINSKEVKRRDASFGRPFSWMKKVFLWKLIVIALNVIKGSEFNNLILVFENCNCFFKVEINCNGRSGCRIRRTGRWYWFGNDIFVRRCRSQWQYWNNSKRNRRIYDSIFRRIQQSWMLDWQWSKRTVGYECSQHHFRRQTSDR